LTPLPRSDYRALSRYTPDRRDVALDLSDNTNLWGTHPAALDRIRAAGTDDLARYPELYADVLRRAVAERFHVDPECVTTGAGADDVLDSAFRAAYAPAARVNYTTPTFSMVGPLARMNGMRTHTVPWSDAVDRPERLVAGEPTIIYICRPNNPTGELVPEEWVERVLGMRRSAAGPLPLVILDEAYADFAGTTLVQWAPRLPNVLVTRTMSKAYGLAGLRCGFGVARADVALEIDKSRGPYKVSRLAAEAAAAVMSDPGGWMAAQVGKCVENRTRLWRELESRRLRPIESYTNFVLVRAPSGSAERDALALRELGTAVRPFTSIPALDEGLRVTVGPWPMMETFLTALDELLTSRVDAGGAA
jgi:histidinol-phosphate aminotransferase